MWLRHIMATSEVTLWTEPTVLVGPVVQAKLLGTVFNRLGWLFHHRWGFKRQTLAFNLQIFEIHVCGCECVYCNVYICYGIHPDVHCLCGNCFGLIEDLAQRTWGQSISRIGSPSLQTMRQSHGVSQSFTPIHFPRSHFSFSKRSLQHGWALIRKVIPSHSVFSVVWICIVVVGSWLRMK